MFQKAVKHESKLRLAISGVSGSGKTYTALALATELSNGGKVAVVDTENGSAEKYADIFAFDVVNIDAPYHPDKYIAAIKEAERLGYDVIILDSISHAWNGTGGVLQLKEEFSKQKGMNDYTAWGPAGDIQNRLIDAMIQCKIHIIVTMRSKMKYAMEEYTGSDGRVRTKPVKVGMGAIQKENMEYEFDIHLEMDDENNAIVGKTRCPVIANRVISKPGAELAELLKDWLRGESLQTDDMVLQKRAEIVEVSKVVYGDEWEAKRPQLVLYVSKKRTSNLDNLSLAELIELLNGIKAKLSKKQEGE